MGLRNFNLLLDLVNIFNNLILVLLNHLDLRFRQLLNNNFGVGSFSEILRFEILGHRDRFMVYFVSAHFLFNAYDSRNSKNSKNNNNNNHHGTGSIFLIFSGSILYRFFLNNRRYDRVYYWVYYRVYWFICFKNDRGAHHQNFGDS